MYIKRIVVSVIEGDVQVEHRDREVDPHVLRHKGVSYLYEKVNSVIVTYASAQVFTKT